MVNALIPNQNKRDKDPEVLRLLNERQYLFVLVYSDHFDVTKAAVYAGYSKKTANIQGNKLLRITKVQNALRHLVAARLAKTELTAELTIKAIYEALTAEIRDFFNDDGTVKHPNELPDKVQRIVEGFKAKSYYDKEREETVNEVEYKFTSRAAARDHALKYFGLLAPEKVELETRVKIDWDDELGGKEDTIEDQIEGVE